MPSSFAGHGVALGLTAMVVFMIRVAQLWPLRLPCVMPFNIPASLVGGALAPYAAGQGLSIAGRAYPG